MSDKDTTGPPKGRLRSATPKGSTKTSESPRDNDCTATVTLDTEIPIIITKSENKTASGRTRSKDTATDKRLSEQETTLKSLCSQMATIQASVVELTSLVKSNKRSLAESECDLDLPRNKHLRIDVAGEGPNAYQDFEPESYSESAADYDLVDDNPEIAYILSYPEDTDIPQLYFVGQDNTAKPVSETLASFVTDAARKKLDPRFLEASLFPKPMWKFGPSSRSYKEHVI